MKEECDTSIARSFIMNEYPAKKGGAKSDQEFAPAKIERSEMHIW